MDFIDFVKNARPDEVKEAIKEAIFEDFRNNGLFGRVNLWQDYMKRELREKLPKDLWKQFDMVVDELVNAGILSLNDQGHYAITETGEEIAYSNEYCTVDTVVDRILFHLNDSGYRIGQEWPIITAYYFSDRELNVYEKRLFNVAIERMISDGFLVCKEANLAYEIIRLER